MSLRRITLSANAGAALRLGGSRIWIDALHRQAVPGFSTLTPPRLSALAAHPDFDAPDLLFYTHCHPDHFSQELTQLALSQWPAAKAVLPEPVFPGQRLLTCRQEELLLPGLSARFIRLPHEGAEYADVPHYGCLLDHNGFRVLATGDCAVASPILASFLQECGPVDLALLDFPWITLRKGRDFIAHHIRPRHVLVCHLPFPEDDCFSYRPAAEKAAGLVDAPDVRLLWEPFQQEEFE